VYDSLPTAPVARPPSLEGHPLLHSEALVNRKPTLSPSCASYLPFRPRAQGANHRGGINPPLSGIFGQQHPLNLSPPTLTLKIYPRPRQPHQPWSKSFTLGSHFRQLTQLTVSSPPPTTAKNTQTYTDSTHFSNLTTSPPLEPPTPETKSKWHTHTHSAATLRRERIKISSPQPVAAITIAAA
jgi:hypothetical protein